MWLSWGFENILKTHVNALLNICKYDVSTMTGKNIRFIMNKYRILTFDSMLMNKEKVSKTVVNDLLEEEEWKINFLEDLVSERDFGDASDNMTTDEIIEIIEHLSTT